MFGDYWTPEEIALYAFGLEGVEKIIRLDALLRNQTHGSWREWIVAHLPEDLNPGPWSGKVNECAYQHTKLWRVLDEVEAVRNALEDEATMQTQAGTAPPGKVSYWGLPEWFARRGLQEQAERFATQQRFGTEDKPPRRRGGTEPSRRMVSALEEADTLVLDGWEKDPAALKAGFNNKLSEKETESLRHYLTRSGRPKWADRPKWANLPKWADDWD